jgi:uncharacterized protein
MKNASIEVTSAPREISETAGCTRMHFKPIDLKDRDVFVAALRPDPPLISEITFTNLFMWRNRYKPLWCYYDGFLLVMVRGADGYFALPPVGEGDKREIIDFLFCELANYSNAPQISRAPKNFVDAYADSSKHETRFDRNNSDYIYLAADLADLPGNKYHKKKNHVNNFVKNNSFVYRSFDEDVIALALGLQEDWCELKDCDENPDLMDENRAIYEALNNYSTLELVGGAIIIDSKVEAFAIGEKLNPETAVIHVEKANPNIQGLYAAINRMYCQENWRGIKYINREQDLGVEGLRKSKESYHPDHLIEKYDVFLK